MRESMHRYYTDEYDEEGRLSRTLKGQLELHRMREIISRHLLTGPKMTVADIGGGAGVHARWMLDLGHSVQMLDPVDTHVDKAARIGIPVARGDARRTPWRDGQFGAALMAGPLYHLKGAVDRKQALSELARVLRPGAPAVVTALNRFAPLIGSTVTATYPAVADAVESIAATGAWEGESGWMAQAYYHTAGEFESELLSAGFEDVTLFGVGGPGTWLGVVADRFLSPGEGPEAALDTAVTSARIADHYEGLLVLSSMFAATVRKGDDSRE